MKDHLAIKPRRDESFDKAFALHALCPICYHSMGMHGGIFGFDGVENLTKCREYGCNCGAAEVVSVSDENSHIPNSYIEVERKFSASMLADIILFQRGEVYATVRYDSNGGGYIRWRFYIGEMASERAREAYKHRWS